MRTFSFIVVLSFFFLFFLGTTGVEIILEVRILNQISVIECTATGRTNSIYQNWVNKVFFYYFQHGFHLMYLIEMKIHVIIQVLGEFISVS